LEVGQEGVSGADADDLSVVDGDALKDEADDADVATS